MAIEKESETLEEKRKEKIRIRKLISKAEVKGKFENYEIDDLKQYMKKNPKYHLSFSYCESCLLITNELFEEPITSRRKTSGRWHCNECKHHNYLEMDKGIIIDEVARRETHKLKYGGEVV